MPLFEDSYKTTLGSAMVTNKIVNGIKEAFIKDGLHHESLNVKSDGEYKPVFILGRHQSEMDIPPFAHPITVTNAHREKYLVTDMRFFVRKDVQTERIEDSIRNLTDFNFAKSRLILNLLWVNKEVNQIRLGLHFAGTVFAALLSEAITKTYVLDYRDQTAVAIATHFYYQSLFSEKTEFDEDDRQKMALHTIKATKAPSEMVFDIFDKIGPIADLKDYCKVVSDVVENVRLKDFSLAVLFSIVGNSWIGINSKEVLNVALEHPPTWIAIVHAALSERTYRNSRVYTVAERHGKRGGATEFMDNYKAIMKDNTEDISKTTVITGRASLEALTILD